MVPQSPGAGPVQYTGSEKQMHPLQWLAEFIFFFFFLLKKGLS
jgi:hypothetical protein